MALNVRAIGANFAGEVEGFDLRQPVSMPDVSAVEEAMDRFAILVFRGQNIADEDLVTFSRNFGPLQDGAAGVKKKTESDQRLRSELADLSNAASHERRLGVFSARRWHTDRTFMPTPAKYSILATKAVPATGGETQFADMRAAYDALPDHLKKLVGGLEAEHSHSHLLASAGFFDDNHKKYAPVQRPLINWNPRNKRTALYISTHASHIVGWPVPEGMDLLYQLMDFATQKEFVYTHKWRLGDVVMWDNLATMHRGRPHYPETDKRDMRRASIELKPSEVEVRFAPQNARSAQGSQAVN